MSPQIKLIILACLIVATMMETAGDAVIRNGLAQATAGGKALYLLAGAALLFGYGVLLNLAPIAFNRVAGIYIAILFVAWQITSFVAFRSVPGLPILIGGALIVAGGLVVAFAGDAEA